MRKITLLIAIMAFTLLWTTPTFADTHRNSSDRGSSGDSNRHDSGRRDSGRNGDSRTDRNRDSGRGSISIHIDIQPKRREVRTWVPGYYETRIERIYHNGYWVEDRIPARYEERVVVVCDPNTGDRWEEVRTIMVEPEHIMRRYVPGWFESRYVSVWHDGYWIVTYQ